MEYIVIKKFTDKTDKHKYGVGDRYPYRGFAKKDRIEELSTRNNKRGVVLIEEKQTEYEDKRDFDRNDGDIEDKPRRRTRTVEEQ